MKISIPLALSACIGGAVGLYKAEWQWAVQIAQVQTGLVAYGPDSVPGLTQGSLWSLTNQLAGLPLMLGLSERAASAVVSFALGALWFEAITLFVFVLSRSAWIGLGAAALCFISRATQGTGLPYPVLSPLTPHTHGVVGLMIPILAVSLLAMERRRFGALLLGLSPAFHALTGVCAIAFAGAAILSNRNSFWPAYRPVVRYFVGGLGLTMVSLVLHVITAPDLPSIDPQTARKFFLAFVSVWDSHRQPVNLIAPGALMAIGSFGAAVLSLFIVRGDGHRAERFLLAFVVCCSLGGVLLAMLTWVPMNQLPMTVVAAMPGRVINLGTVMFVPLLIGLVGAAVQRKWGLAMGSPIKWATAVLMTCAFLWMAVPYLKRAKGGPLWNRSDESVMSAASTGRGLLLTGGDLWLIQLQTRRAVLLDGYALDTLPYVVETSVLTNQVLRDVYGIDLLDPPFDAGAGRVPNATNRAIWEKYPRSRWQEIAQLYGVTQVLTRSSWVLDLPLETSSSELRLYSIPDK